MHQSLQFRAVIHSTEDLSPACERLHQRMLYDTSEGQAGGLMGQRLVQIFQPVPVSVIFRNLTRTLSTRRRENQTRAAEIS